MGQKEGGGAMGQKVGGGGGLSPQSYAPSPMLKPRVSSPRIQAKKGQTIEVEFFTEQHV